MSQYTLAPSELLNQEMSIHQTWCTQYTAECYHTFSRFNNPNMATMKTFEMEAKLTQF